VTGVARPGPFRLDGQVALVTGATKNIGRAIAGTFAAAGASLVLTARTASDLEARCAELRARGTRVHPVVGDVASDDDVRRTVAAAQATFGRIDVLVNNAYSAGRARPFALDVPDEDWDSCWRANVLGPYRLMQLAGRLMIDNGGGSIINILSISAFRHDPGMTAYAATKAALWSLTRYIATEAAPAVRVNAISPGPITDDGLPRSKGMERNLPLIPMARGGLPGEIATVALFLASPASSYVTGQVVGVDGGLARHVV